MGTPTRYHYLRLYHEVRTDPKLALFDDSEFRVWINLLCYASEREDRGTIEIDDIELLAIEVARGDTELLERTIAKCVRLRILSQEGDEITFVHFVERQYDKPSDTPSEVSKRVAKHRQQRAETPKQDDVTPSNAMKRAETPREEKRREEEIREEKKHNPLPDKQSVADALPLLLKFSEQVAEITAIPLTEGPPETLVAQEANLRKLRDICDERGIDWQEDLSFRLRRDTSVQQLKKAACPAVIIGRAAEYACRDNAPKPKVPKVKVLSATNREFNSPEEEAAWRLEEEYLDKMRQANGGAACPFNL